MKIWLKWWMKMEMLLVNLEGLHEENDHTNALYIDFDRL